MGPDINRGYWKGPTLCIYLLQKDVWLGMGVGMGGVNLSTSQDERDSLTFRWGGCFLKKGAGLKLCFERR